MLSAVPAQLAKLSRTVVINHPNAWSCQVLRKIVNRMGASVGEMPTMGGLMVLDSEDEEDIDFEPLGNGYAVQVVDAFQPALMMDRQDANNMADTQRFMIEPEDAPGTAGWFAVHKHDVVYLSLGDGLVKLAFEVVAVETPLNMPAIGVSMPYAQRYVMNRRDDLHIGVPP